MHAHSIHNPEGHINGDVYERLQSLLGQSFFIRCSSMPPSPHALSKLSPPQFRAGGLTRKLAPGRERLESREHLAATPPTQHL